jgi:hypothetical protein
MRFWPNCLGGPGGEAKGLNFLKGTLLLFVLF